MVRAVEISASVESGRRRSRAPDLYDGEWRGDSDRGERTRDQRPTAMKDDFSSAGGALHQARSATLHSSGAAGALDHGSFAWEIGDDRVKFTVGARAGSLLQALVELVDE